MKLIGIECEQTQGSADWVVVSSSHIVSVFEFENKVVISLSDGTTLFTKFTDVNHATDYIQKASSEQSYPLRDE